jgi:hypothetical protein
MSPEEWSYELVEAWFPGTTWNPSGQHVGICSDWEPYEGRSSYASIGGCYYAAAPWSPSTLTTKDGKLP